MVEQVEGFCSESDWRRAYGEINDFEKQMYDAGVIVIKFWLAIDKEDRKPASKPERIRPANIIKLLMKIGAIVKSGMSTPKQCAIWSIIPVHGKHPGYLSRQTISILLVSKC